MSHTCEYELQLRVDTSNNCDDCIFYREEDYGCNNEWHSERLRRTFTESLPKCTSVRRNNNGITYMYQVVHKATGQPLSNQDNKDLVNHYAKNSRSYSRT